MNVKLIQGLGSLYAMEFDWLMCYFQGKILYRIYFACFFKPQILIYSYEFL